MGNRKAITEATVAAVAAENAGHPLPPERVAALTEALEGALQGVDALRALPLKDLEPALVFQPILTPVRGAKND